METKYTYCNQATPVAVIDDDSVYNFSMVIKYNVYKIMRLHRGFREEAAKENQMSGNSIDRW